MKKHEEGQAIVELTISLIAIMVVFLGVIFAFALGNANVEGIINARGECDNYAGNGNPQGDSGRHILDWSPGNDERIMTNDDTSIIGGNDYPEFFTGELKYPLDLTSGFEGAHVLNNFADDVNGVGSIFLAMANLTKSTKTTDPYDEGLLEDLQGAFRELIYDSDMEIENSAYMPIFYSEE